MNAKYGNGIFLALFSLLVFCAFINTAFASTLYVPDDYSTIQAAVNAANAGDTIIVRERMYTENVDVNKRLTIRSENGYANCIIQAKNPNDHVFEVTASYVNISGFMVKGAIDGYKTGIKLYDIDHCNISNNNVSNNCYGIGLFSSSNNKITENDISSNNWKDIYLTDSSNNNTITKNNCYGIFLIYSNNNKITKNNISTSPGIVIEGIGLFSSSNNRITENVFVNSGLFVRYSYNNIVEDNKVNNKPLVYLEEASNQIITESGQVILVNCENITVKNLNLSKVYVGVELWGTYNSKITNVTTSNNYEGIWLDFSSNNTIKKNNISSNSHNGIGLISSSNNNIMENNISSNSYGIQLFYSNNNNKIMENNISNNSHGIFSYSNNNNTITENNFVNDGLYVYDSYNNIVEDNTVNNKPLVYLEEASNQVITEAGQVILVNCENITVENVNLSKTDVGIELWGTKNSKIMENKISLNNWCGIYLDDSSNNNTIMENNISNNRHGIDLYFSSNNKITKNNISNNHDGIELDNSSNNKITKNNISSNSWYGIYLNDSSKNTIYLNNIEDSVDNVDSSNSNNIWNSTSKITYIYKGTTYENYLGNYWEDYTGLDADKDGIGDTSYPIDSDKDNYPLKVPFENYFAKPTPTPTPKLTVTPTLEPSPKPTVTPALEPIEDAFNYNGEYTLDQAKLREEEKKALPYVMKYANEYKVSPCLIMAVIRQESDFFDYSQDPEKDKTKFDIGYMQVSHIAAIDTYKEYPGDEYKGTEEEWQRDGLDLDINIKYGTRYLRIQYERIKDGHYKDVYNDILKSTLSAYNAGHPTKDNSKYVDGVIQGRDLIDGPRRGYEFFLTIRVPVGGVPVPEKSIPGFEVIFAIAEILAVAYLVRRRK